MGNGTLERSALCSRRAIWTTVESVSTDRFAKLNVPPLLPKNRAHQSSMLGESLLFPYQSSERIKI